MVIRPDTLPQPLPSQLENQPAGALSPKSEKLVRDLERILAPSKHQRSSNRTCYHRQYSLEDSNGASNDSSQLASKMSDFHSELEMAYKKALDICANLNTAAQV